MKPVDTLHIPEARFIENGRTVLVQPALEGEPLRPGRVAYDENKHRMKLLCPHCDVRVDFNKGSGAGICGNNLAGARPHFKKAPKMAHGEDCILPLREAREGHHHSFDPDKGYRINLNVSGWPSLEFNERARPYERAQGGKIIINDERLMDRERFKAQSVEDFLKFIRRGEFGRLRDSLVVHGSAVMPWENFMIRYDKKTGHERFRQLADRLLRGASHPVLMEVRFYNAPASDKVAQSERIFYRRDDKDRAHFIVPRVYLDSNRVADSFPVRGSYLVMGVPRIKTIEEPGRVIHFLNLSLKEPGHTAQFNIRDVLLEANANALKRRTRMMQPG